MIRNTISFNVYYGNDPIKFGLTVSKLLRQYNVLPCTKNLHDKIRAKKFIFYDYAV